MDAVLLRTFQEQVALQCRFLLLATEELEKSLNDENCTILRVFFALQNLFGAGANIAKALWGKHGTPPENRKALGESVGISDDSPLKRVSMRNNFEHFDERIDRWWKSSNGHNFADLNIGPNVTLDDIDSFRSFNPTTSDLSFWGQKFNVQELIDEVCAILPKLDAELAKSL
ncbi:MAG: hypothetical protein JWN70_4012 [Planctomycetaceae bacterium]|nr:hypothetical protein [Planctomycetaceae bacterium]